MTNSDEPILNNNSFFDFPSSSETSHLPEQIRRLVTSQPYGVLCTQGESQPYGSLIAFATTENLENILFATPIATRKYRLLNKCHQVALLIDNRDQHMDNMMEIEAVTATGVAIQIEKGKEFNHWANILVSKHPHLKSFVFSPTTALFRIQIIRYFHVMRFQEVHQWVPPANG